MSRVVLAVITMCVALTWSYRASAFHAGNVFDKPAGAGGGGGVFYAGAQREHGWDCTACHTDAPGAIKLELASEPPDLLRSFRYEPGKAYDLTATLVGEHAGAGASNFNSLVVSLVDAKGAPAGEIVGYAADEFYGSGPSTIASAGQHPGVSRWSFKWLAPKAAGPVKLHMAAVDGNGADGAGGNTMTDPFGDDVFVGALTLESSATARASKRNGRDAMFGAGFAACAFACAFGIRRRGGRR